MTIVRDPIYRYYNCNIQAPNLKCETLSAKEIDITEQVLSPSGIHTYNGYKPLATSHTFTTADIPVLENATMCGELTMYAVNPGQEKAGVVFASLAKSEGQYTYLNFFQSNGNLTGVTFNNGNTSPGNMLSFTILFSPAVAVRWVFRGV
jgi:hypothetical protein